MLSSLLGKIDNSDRAVSKRLDYLRGKGIETTGIFMDVQDEAVLKLPREIEFKFRAYAYCVGYAATDYKHYCYTEDTMIRAMSYYRTSNCIKSDGEPYELGDYLKLIARTDSAHYYIPENLMSWDKANLLVDYKLMDIKTQDDFKIPEDVKKLGVPEKDWNEWFRKSLRNYYWEGAGTTYLKEHSCKVEETQAEYLLRMEPVIDVYINGERSYAFNLTITEKEKIIEMIDRDKRTEGKIISDGKEDVKYANRPFYYTKRDIAKGVNSMRVYGERVTDR